MKRPLQFIALIFALLSLVTGGLAAPSDKSAAYWVNSALPQGVTVRTATPIQLAAAVKAAIKAHPKQAKGIVSYVFSQLTAADSAKALAVIDAIISAVPADEVAGLIKIAIESLSSTVDPQTGLSARSVLSPVITQEAIADDPGLASVILAAIGTASVPGSTTQLLGPGGVTNPANFSNTSGPVNSPQ